ncbi:MAG: hypothetical protein K2Y31_17735 [Burkholderiales bacterium]|nr:hypothetical protein [Burkholderiales bacterium]
MLIIFVVMSLGAYGFNSKWLAHELDHERQAPVALADHDHTPQLDHESSQSPEPLSDAEHKLLHALYHGQHFVNSVFYGLGISSVRTAPLSPVLLALPLAEFESPYRPPRSLALI